MSATGIGVSVKRKEDIRFITGKGHYVDDINRPGQAYAFFVRSPHAHATIDKIDASAALKSPGVVAVFTGADAVADKIGAHIPGWTVHSKDGSPMKVGSFPALAHGKALYVGDPVAVVIADTYAQAKDGAEKMVVDYGVLPAVIDTASAAKPGQPQIHDYAPGNTVFNWHVGDKASTDAAFAKAAHVTTLDLINNRTIPNAMEPRAALGEYDSGTDVQTLHTTSQNPHVARVVLSAFQGVAPENKLRVIAPDVGGGFGSKIFIYNEETVCIWAAKKIDRPVKWTAERTESFLADAHGRDHVSHAELALDASGKILGDAGPYDRQSRRLSFDLLGARFRPISMGFCCRGSMTSPQSTVRSTGSTPIPFPSTPSAEPAARRRPSWSSASSRRRRARPDAIRPISAARTSSSRSRIRRRSSSPMTSATMRRRSTRRSRSPTTRASARARRPRPPRASCAASASRPISRRAASRLRRRPGSLGAGVGLWESAEVRVNMVGTVEVLTGCHSHGQGHETTYAQLVCSRLGIPIENVSIVHGDTDKVQMGMGTYGSRSGAVGMSAISKALDKIEAKAKKVAGHVLEASDRTSSSRTGSSRSRAPTSRSTSSRSR